MRQKILQAISDRLPARIIKRDEDSDYMVRYFLFRLGPITAYLHRFLDSDGDCEVHDHPWAWSVGIPLVGGYVEERLTAWDVPVWQSNDRWIFAFRPNFIGARDFHRIEYVLPGTWTLFIHGPRTSRWGFLRRLNNDNLMYVSRYTSSGRWWENAPRGREILIKRRAS